MRATRRMERRDNPGGADALVPLIFLGIAGFAFYEYAKTHPGAFGDSGTSGSGGAASAAAPASAPTTAQPPAPPLTVPAGYPTDANSHAADPYGQNLWGAQHPGDPNGYLNLNRADQVTWNSVAIHGR